MPRRSQPASLHVGEATATFAANRRVQFTPRGPVDHRVPVLRVDAPARPRAIVFGYACHNTTLRDDFVEFHGDYAGVAQAELEARHPGATALFVAGCGADANPDAARHAASSSTRTARRWPTRSNRGARASDAGSTARCDGVRRVDLPFAPAAGSRRSGERARRPRTSTCAATRR